MNQNSARQIQLKPEYLKKGIVDFELGKNVRKILKEFHINTVCDAARCPNKAQCFAANTATFLIMGKFCTRNCKFCNIENKKPELLDKDEPQRIAKAVKKLKLKYVVITSVTRDDLKDGGANHFCETIMTIRKLNPETKIEVLTPDFKGDKTALDIVLNAKPDVFNHNLETVKSLYKKVRPQAIYERSLEVLKYAASKTIIKTGLMTGLGEKKDELLETFNDLSAINCNIVTLGQYIPPTKYHLPVEKYYTPNEFEDLKNAALNSGVKIPIFEPLVRSSFNAFKAYKAAAN